MPLETRVERRLAALVARVQTWAWYSAAEFARLVGRSVFTRRE